MVCVGVWESAAASISIQYKDTNHKHNFLGGNFYMQNIIMAVSIAILVVLSSFFSSMETAVNSASRARFLDMQENGVKRAKLALLFLDEYEKTITTLLIGNNIVNIGCSSIATILCTNLWGSYGAAISTGALTLIILTFGEVLPKCNAKENSERIIIRYAAPVYTLMVLFTPLSLLFIKINDLAVKMRKKDDEEKPSVTEDELKYIIESIEEEGVLEETESEMVQSALEFDEKTVLKILTPRVDVISIDINDPPEVIAETIVWERYTRLPVYEDSIDNIIGILNTRDFLEVLACGDTPNIRELLQPAYFVYKKRKLSALLADFKRNKQHIAMVTDEYGGFMGIVTMEDLLEELVGDIWDEDEEIENPCRELSDGSFEVSGDMQLDELLELYDIPIKSVETTSNSVGGWVVECLGNVPEQGAALKVSGLDITVSEVADRRIIKLIVKKPAKAEQD